MSAPTQPQVRAGQVWSDCERGPVRVIAVADGYALLNRRRRNPFLASVDQMQRGEYGWELVEDTPPPSVPVAVDGVRTDYQPAFDSPTNAGEALAWLSQQGDPTCMTFNADKARRAAELLRDALHQPATDSATASVFAELGRAVQKFPTWPTDPLHAVAVLGEEFGELTKAVLQSVYEPHKVEPGEVRQEALQTAAMALRFLRSLDAYVFTPGAQHDQPALAQHPAAVDCPHRTRCDCLAACKYGYASDGATQDQEPKSHG